MTDSATPRMTAAAREGTAIAEGCKIEKLRINPHHQCEDYQIVAKIWEQLGNPTYEELKGKSIHDLIDDLKQRGVRDKAEIERLKELLSSMEEARSLQNKVQEAVLNRTEAAELRAEEFRKDAERLDWCNTRDMYIEIACDGASENRMCRVSYHGAHFGSTLREAIDAAIAGKP